MSDFKAVVFAAKDGTPLGELPAASYAWRDTYLGAGDLSVDVPLFLDPMVWDWDTLRPAKCGLVICVDDEPVSGGIIWTMKADPVAEKLTVSAGGFHSYYKNRFLDSSQDWIYSQVEQFKILTSWIDHCNDTDGIGTTYDDKAASGVLRDRTWLGSEFKNIGDAIDQLSQVINGFDFRYEAYLDTGMWGNRIVLTYPNTGTVRDVKLVASQNCAIDGIDYDGTNVMRDAVSIGTDDDDQPILSWLSNDDVTAEYPASMSVTTYSDIKELPTLDDKSSYALKLGAQPIVIPSLKVYPQRNPELKLRVGDVVQVAADFGFCQIPEPGEDDHYRITEIQNNVGDTLFHEQVVTLVRSELFL